MQDRVKVAELDEKHRDMDFSNITMQFNTEQNFLYLKRGELARKFISENNNLPPNKKKKKKSVVGMATTPVSLTLDSITKDAFETLMAKLKLHWIGTPGGWNDYYSQRCNDFARIPFDDLADLDIPYDVEEEEEEKDNEDKNNIHFLC